MLTCKRALLVSCEPPAEEDKRAQFDESGNQIRDALTKRQVVLEMTMDIWKARRVLLQGLEILANVRSTHFIL